MKLSEEQAIQVIDASELTVKTRTGRLVKACWNKEQGIAWDAEGVPWRPGYWSEKPDMYVDQCDFYLE